MLPHARIESIAHRRHHAPRDAFITRSVMSTVRKAAAMMRIWAALIMVAGSATLLSAQPSDTLRINETFAKNVRYHVSCQVEITGTLTPAANAKDANPKPIKVSGRSAIEYDERILNVTADRKIDRTVRHYRQLVFDRKVGEEEQHSKLRPEASRLVILRHNQYEVPFCPSGPLLWS